MAQTRYPEHYVTDEALLDLTQNVHLYLESTCVSLLKRYNRISSYIVR